MKHNIISMFDCLVLFLRFSLKCLMPNIYPSAIACLPVNFTVQRLFSLIYSRYLNNIKVSFIAIIEIRRL